MALVSHSPSPLPSERGRKAFTLLELVVTAAMLAVLMTLVTSTFSAVERDTRRTDRRVLAMTTLENVLEEFLLAPWEEVSDQRIAALPLPETFVQRWPRATLTGEVAATADLVVGKRVSLTLTIDPNARERPLTLTTWIYPAPQE